MSFDVKIWGARGSMPCTGASHATYGGDTACIELTIDTRRVVIDAGTGLAQLGLTHPNRAYACDLLLSHGHLDHVQGIPFFAPLYRGDSEIRLWRADPDPLAPLLDPPLSPVSLDLMRGLTDIHIVQAGDVLDLGDGITVRTLALNHPGGSLGFRVEAQGKVFTTLFDHEPGIVAAIDAAIPDFARNSDLLVVDATFDATDLASKRGWGHGTWEQACDIAKSCGARQLLLFHHDPRNDDVALDEVERAAQAVFSAASCARQGSTVSL
ncbi:MBL fold metallo-hydrolase [Roseiterribacter gracilis]|uniref:MBL fold metallo-hydrolase n=1 Tax=Roseiterribacter gracilis TaxID=2812848 RepID=A0A8S8XDJ4_9PROT|nr:MBL fold metallo-hydrolase [Rhodospirillales bacterium TMPK1]